MLRPAIDLAGIDLADLTSICLVLMAIFDVVASEDLGLLVCLIALRDDPVVCAVFPLFLGMSWAGGFRRYVILQTSSPQPGAPADHQDTTVLGCWGIWTHPLLSEGAHTSTH
jgi:hypothetical protein